MLSSVSSSLSRTFPINRDGNKVVRKQRSSRGVTGYKLTDEFTRSSALASKSCLKGAETVALETVKAKPVIVA